MQTLHLSSFLYRVGGYSNLLIDERGGHSMKEEKISSLSSVTVVSNALRLRRIRID
jgi:hypothetical protein